MGKRGAVVAGSVWRPRRDPHVVHKRRSAGAAEADESGLEIMQALLDPQLDPSGHNELPDYGAFTGFLGRGRLAEAEQVAGRLCEHWYRMSHGEADVLFGYEADHTGTVSGFWLSTPLGQGADVSVISELDALSTDPAATGWAAALAYAHALDNLAGSLLRRCDQVLRGHGRTVR